MHSVQLGSRAGKELERCSSDLREALLEAIEALALEPRPPSCKKLSGALSGSYRIRVGSYRVLYDVHDKERVVMILKIGPRKSIYR